MHIPHLYNRNFIPGPAETKEAFLARVSQVEALLADSSPILKALILSEDDLFLIHDNQLAFRRDKGLPFWCAGMTLLCEMDDGTQIPIIQLHQQKKKRSFWPRLKEKEIIAHERIHSLRIAFQEPRFEEMIAYRTSKARWRRFWGALLQNQKEVYCFFLLLLIPWILLLFKPEISALTIGLIGFTPLFLYLGALIIRLIFRQNQLARTLKMLKRLTSHGEEILPFLTDKEIATATLPEKGMRAHFIDMLFLKETKICTKN